MCFSKCTADHNTDWFDAAINNDIKIIQAQMKANSGRRDIRQQEQNIFPGFTAFFYSVYHQNLEVLSILLPEEFPLPTVEPIIFDEDQMLESQVNAVLPKEEQVEDQAEAETEKKVEPIEPILDKQKKRFLEKLRRIKDQEVEQEYNIREFPSNSTALDLAVHQSNWNAFDLMYQSILFQYDTFSPILGYMNEHGETTLHFFVRNGSPDALYMLKRTGRMLVQKEIDKEGDNGLNPVVLSIRAGRVDFLEYFLSLAYDDYFFDRLKFCLRKQKRKPAVEELCTPSLMFNTSEEEAQQASFLLQGFRRRSLPAAPEWLVLEIKDKIDQMNRSSYEEPIEEGPVAPWLQKQKELNIIVDAPSSARSSRVQSGNKSHRESLQADSLEVPIMTPKLEHFIKEEKQNDGLLHVYEQVALPRPKHQLQVETSHKVATYGTDEFQEIESEESKNDENEDELVALDLNNDPENSVEDL